MESRFENPPTWAQQDSFSRIEEIVQPQLPSKAELEQQAQEIRRQVELSSHAHLSGSKVRKNKSKKIRLAPKDRVTRHVPYWDVKWTLQLSAMQCIRKDSFAVLDCITEQYMRMQKVLYPASYVNAPKPPKEFVLDLGEVFAFHTHHDIIKQDFIQSCRSETRSLGYKPFSVVDNKFIIVNQWYPLLSDGKFTKLIWELPRYGHDWRIPHPGPGIFFTRIDELDQVKFGEAEACPAPEYWESTCDVIATFALSVMACGNYKNAFDHFRSRFCYITNEDRNHHWAMAATCYYDKPSVALTVLAISLEYAKGISTREFSSTRKLFSALNVKTNLKEIYKLLDEYDKAGRAGGPYFQGTRTNVKFNGWRWFSQHPLLAPAYNYLRVKAAIYTNICNFFRVPSGIKEISLAYLIVFASKFWSYDDVIGQSPNPSCLCKYDYAQISDTNRVKCVHNRFIRPPKSKTTTNQMLDKHFKNDPNIHQDTCDHNTDDDSTDSDYEEASPGYKSVLEATILKAKDKVVDAKNSVNDAIARRVDQAKGDIRVFMKELLKDVRQFVSETMGDFFKSALAPFETALNSVKEFIQPVLNFFNAMTDGAAKLLQGMLNKLGFHNFVVRDRISISDIVTSLICYMIFNSTQSRVVKVLVIAFTVWRYKLHTIFPQLWKMLKNAFISSEDEVHSDTSAVDWMSLDLLLDESYSGTLSKIITFFLCAICGYACTKNSRMHISEMFCAAFRNIHFVGAGLLGIIKIMEVFEKVLPSAITYIREKLGKDTSKTKEGEEKEKCLTQDFKKKAAHFIAFVQSLDNEQGIEIMKTSLRIQKKVVEMLHVATAMQSALLDEEIYKLMDADFRYALRQAIKDHKKLFNICYRVCKYGNFRYTPFHVQFFGEPGHGKTSMIQSLTNAIASEYYPEMPKANLVWSKPIADHYDGYHGQKIMVMDDVWKQNDPTQFVEMLTIVSNTPTVVPMAHLEDKATYLTSDWVVSTVNVPFPNIKDVLCLKAVYRRRHVLAQVVCDPRCMDKNTSKFSKALFDQFYPNVDNETFRRTLPHMSFNIVKPVPPTGGSIEYMNGKLPDMIQFGEHEELPAGLERPLVGLTFTQLVSKIFQMRCAMRAEEDLIRTQDPNYFVANTEEVLNMVDHLVNVYDLEKRWKLYEYLKISDEDLFAENSLRSETPLDVTPEEEDELFGSLPEAFDDLLSAMSDDPGSRLDQDSIFPSSDTSDQEPQPGTSGDYETFEQRRDRILKGRKKGQVPSTNRPFGSDVVGSIVPFGEYTVPPAIPFHSGYHYYKYGPHYMPVTKAMRELWPNIDHHARDIKRLNIDFLKNVRNVEDPRFHFGVDYNEYADLFTQYSNMITQNGLARAANKPLPYPPLDSYNKYNIMCTSAYFVEQMEIFNALPRGIAEYVVNFAHTAHKRIQSWLKWQVSVKHIWMKTLCYTVNAIYGTLFYSLQALAVLIPIIIIGIYVAYVVIVFRALYSYFSVKEKDDTSRVYFRQKSSSVFHKDTCGQLEQNYTSKISRNLFSIRDEAGSTCNGIGLDGHFLMVPFHAVRSTFERGEDIKLLVRPTTNSTEEWELVFENENCHLIPNTDAMIMYNRYMPSNSKINHLFVTEKDLEGEVPLNIFLAANLYEGNRLAFHTHHYDVKRLHSNYHFTSKLLGSRIGAKILEFEGTAPIGSSGGVIYSPSKYSPRGIYGVQSNRKGDISYVAVVTQENIAAITEKYRSKNMVHEGPFLCDTSTVTTQTATLITSHLRVVGQLTPDHVVGFVTKTAYQKSILADEFPSQRVPALLNPFDTRVFEGTHPLAHSVNKFGRDTMKPLDLARLTRAKEAIVEYTRGLIGPMKLRQLNVVEAIEGLREDGFKPMNTRTSPGLPWVLSNPDVGKRHWIRFDEKGDLEYLHPNLPTHIGKWLANFQMGVIPAISMYEFPKDELRPIEKALGSEGSAQKTRAITVTNFILGIIFRMYHLDLEAQLHKKANGVSQFCVGINPEGRAWTTMYHDLKSVGNYGFDFDVSNWDGHFPPELWFAVTDAVCDLYEDGDAARRVRECVADCTIFGHDQWMDLVFQKLRGMPSGHPGTAFTNTYGHMILFYYFWLELCEEKGHLQLTSFEAYRRHVGVRFYGDDVICVLSEHIRTLGFSAADFAGKYAFYGWPVTAAEKTEDPNVMKPLSKLTFLKRSFITDPIYGTGLILGGIEKSVINDLLHWIRKTKDMDLQLYENIHSALEFAFPYGREFYERIRCRVNQTLLTSGRRTYQYTYQDMRDLILSRID